MRKHETANQLMIRLMLKEVKDDIQLSNQRILILRNDKDSESLEVECESNKRFMSKKDLLERVFEIEKGSSSSTPKKVSISHFNRYGGERVLEEIEAVATDDYYYTRADIKLKDYEKLKINRIYRFDSLNVVYDGEGLITRYDRETMWYPMNESEEYFKRWSDRMLFDTGDYINKLFCAGDD